MVALSALLGRAWAKLAAVGGLILIALLYAASLRRQGATAERQRLRVQAIEQWQAITQRNRLALDQLRQAQSSRRAKQRAEAEAGQRNHLDGDW